MASSKAATVDFAKAMVVGIMLDDVLCCYLQKCSAKDISFGAEELYAALQGIFAAKLTALVEVLGH